MADQLTSPRRSRVRFALVVIALVILASPLYAETFEGCSWAGPKPEWTLDLTLPEVNLAGALGSREVIGRLHAAGVSVSFISAAGAGPEVDFKRFEPISVRELLDELMAQAPDYRLSVVGGKLVIYPLDSGYDELVEVGDSREEKRIAAFDKVIKELRSKSPVLDGLRLPTLRPFGGLYGNLISVGGVRTVVEHLVSLVTGSPSANFVIRPRKDGAMQYGLMWADVVEALRLEMPRRVEVGEEFQVVPRVFLVDGTPVTLIGSGCGVRLESNDESLLEIYLDGRGVAIAEGTAWIQAKYEGITVNVKVEVGNGADPD